jgi:hypothetical protein
MNRCAAAGVLRIKHQQLSTQNIGSVGLGPSAALHHLSAARKEYQSAVDTYSANRHKSVMFGFVTLPDANKSGDNSCSGSKRDDCSFLVLSAARQRADCISCLWSRSAKSNDYPILTDKEFLMGEKVTDGPGRRGRETDMDSERGVAKRFRVDFFRESLASEFDALEDCDDAFIHTTAGAGDGDGSSESTVPQSQPPLGRHMSLTQSLSCKIDLGTPRRLVDVQYSYDVRACVRSLRERCSSASIPSQSASGRRVLCGLVVFPASFLIQCQAASVSSAASDNILFSDVHK